MSVEKIFFARDSSELSNEVEEYLIKGGFDYNVYYTNEKDWGRELPAIFPPDAYAFYRGKTGFELFKKSHPIEVVE